uniref:WGS project CBMI000000000 data, contig CS3069_c003756 n=1 Tax=Fusarium clavum TaxID=2594811 RepID=A0A090MK22_9HYPO|nr:unnamed protein product [Fusarium clavum]
MRLSTVLALALPTALAWDQKCDLRPVNGGDPPGQNLDRWTITGKDIGEEVAGDAFCNGIYDNLNCWTRDWECKRDVQTPSSRDGIRQVESQHQVLETKAIIGGEDHRGLARSYPVLWTTVK